METNYLIFKFNEDEVIIFTDSFVDADLKVEDTANGFTITAVTDRGEFNTYKLV